MISEEMLASETWTQNRSDAPVWVARLLVDEGVDLMGTDAADLDRGTPVYVRAEAEVLDVQRAMARNHIRLLPVVKDDEVIGVLDLVELAMKDLDAGSTAAQAASG